MIEQEENILEIRNTEYANAWKVAGELISHIFLSTTHTTKFDDLINSGYMHNWVLCLSKLIRIVALPTKLDNWIDLRNYADLVAEDLEK